MLLIFNRILKFPDTEVRHIYYIIIIIYVILLYYIIYNIIYNIADSVSSLPVQELCTVSCSRNLTDGVDFIVLLKMIF